jgi:hypothetical protein
MHKSRFASVLLLLVLGAAVLYTPRGRAITWTQPTPPVVPQVQSSTGAASAISATLTGSSGKVTYLEGFDVYGTGATAASAINVTVTGTSNTLNFSLGVPAGVSADLGTARQIVRFPSPIPASTLGGNITVSVPSFGAGNTQAAVTVYGFTQ